MKTALYRHYSKNKTLLYVGISINPFRRLKQHRRNARWYDKVTTVTIEKYHTRREALFAEELAIKKEKPIYNKIHNIKKERSMEGVLTSILWIVSFLGIITVSKMTGLDEVIMRALEVGSVVSLQYRMGGFSNV